MKRTSLIEAGQAESFDKLISAIRFASGISASQISIYILNGEHVRTYADYETGVRKPSYNKANEILSLWAAFLDPKIEEVNKSFPGEDTQCNILSEDLAPLTNFKESLKEARLKYMAEKHKLQPSHALVNITPRALDALTKKELASLLGIEVQVYRYYELGRMCPKWAEGRRMLKNIALGIKK